jgi:hypothetical protein
MKQHNTSSKAMQMFSITSDYKIIKIIRAAATQQSTTEPVPNKYNLMAETFGRKWYEVPMDKYLSPSDCTIGK